MCTSAKFSSRRSKRKANQLKLLLEKVSPEKLTKSLIDKPSLDDCSTNAKTQSLFWSVFSGESGVSEEGKEWKGLGVQNKVRNIVYFDVWFFVTTLFCLKLFFLKARNTPLHLAAASGLLDCVEVTHTTHHSHPSHHTHAHTLSHSFS